MRSEEVLVYSRAWPVTSALTAMLQAGYDGEVKALYTTASLASALRQGGRGPVVLGLNPHEYVMVLYRLQALLSCRPVVFVSSRFYWTDYRLPAFFGLEEAGFCTDDMLHGTGRLRVTPEWLFRQCVRVPVSVVRVPRLRSGLGKEVVLWWVNYWLHHRMVEAGLSDDECEVLSDLAEGEAGRFPVKRRSMLKTSGLDKLITCRHTQGLYRGVKVRPELQAEYDEPDDSPNRETGERRHGRKNDERRYLRGGV